MAIQSRRGNEADFDPAKMLPGEWAVSLDTKYVRMCFAPGICLRMATYESFEADMAEIRRIVSEAKTIQEAIIAIQTNVNDIQIVVEKAGENAAKSAIESESYAHGGTGTRENEDTDCAQYYYEQAKRIAQGVNGLIPMGTITFAELSNIDNQVEGYLFNISDEFTTDDTFKEGAGHLYGAGTNIYRTADGYWDAMVSSAVLGVKGASESSYRQGCVNITPENIGAINADGGFTSNAKVGFEVVDVEEPAEWSNMPLFSPGTTHAALFTKIARLFKNVRFLYKILGTTDISAIGDGTVTGVVVQNNSDIKDVQLYAGMAWNSTQSMNGTFIDGSTKSLKNIVLAQVPNAEKRYYYMPTEAEKTAMHLTDEHGWFIVRCCKFGNEQAYVHLQDIEDNQKFTMSYYNGAWTSWKKRDSEWFPICENVNPAEITVNLNSYKAKEFLIVVYNGYRSFQRIKSSKKYADDETVFLKKDTSYTRLMFNLWAAAGKQVSVTESIRDGADVLEQTTVSIFYR